MSLALRVFLTVAGVLITAGGLWIAWSGPPWPAHSPGSGTTLALILAGFVVCGTGGVVIATRD